MRSKKNGHADTACDMPSLKVTGPLLLALLAALPIGAALWAVGAQMLDAAAPSLLGLSP